MPIVDDEQFHAERRTAITSTDMAKILGLSPWGSPRSVYLEKVDPQPPRPMSLAARLGLELEPTVARLFMEDTGYRVRRLRGFYRSQDRSHVASHADYAIIGERWLLECKTRRDDTGWGAPMTSVVPVDVWIQCQIEMLCLKKEITFVGVLFGFGEYRTLLVDRDDAFIKEALARADQFWNENVLAGVMPDVIFADLDDLKTEYPADTDGTLRTATPDIDVLIEKYAAARELRLEAQRKEDTLKARLQRFIGNNAGVQGNNGVVTWKRDNPNPQYDPEAYALGLAALAVEQGIPADVLARLKEESMSTRDPQRKFNWRKG